MDQNVEENAVKEEIIGKPEDEQFMANIEANIIRRHRRSSILKPNKLKSEKFEDSEIDDDPTRPVRRVSFASNNTIKPFLSDPDKNTIWDQTYEEELNSDQEHAVAPFSITQRVNVVTSTSINTNCIDLDITRANDEESEPDDHTTIPSEMSLTCQIPQSKPVTRKPFAELIDLSMSRPSDEVFRVDSDSISAAKKIIPRAKEETIVKESMEITCQVSFKNGDDRELTCQQSPPLFDVRTAAQFNCNQHLRTEISADCADMELTCDCDANIEKSVVEEKKNLNDINFDTCQISNSFVEQSKRDIRLSLHEMELTCSASMDSPRIQTKETVTTKIGDIFQPELVPGVQSMELTYQSLLRDENLLVDRSCEGKHLKSRENISVTDTTDVCKMAAISCYDVTMRSVSSVESKDNFSPESVRNLEAPDPIKSSGTKLFNLEGVRSAKEDLAKEIAFKTPDTSIGAQSNETQFLLNCNYSTGTDTNEVLSKKPNTHDTYILGDKNHDESVGVASSSQDLIPLDETSAVLAVDFDESDEEEEENFDLTPYVNRKLELKHYEFKEVDTESVKDLNNEIIKYNKKITEYLQNFKMKPYELPELVIPELPRVKKSERIESGSLNLLDKIKNMQKSCSKSWEFVRCKDDMKFVFSTLYTLIDLEVSLRSLENMKVEDFQLLISTDNIPPFEKYLCKLFLDKMEECHIISSIGANYDLFSFLEYLHMVNLKFVDFVNNWIHLRKQHFCEINENFVLTFMVLETSSIVWVEVSINVSSLDKITPEDIQIIDKYGSVDENLLKQQITTCPKDLNFVKNFIEIVVLNAKKSKN